MKLNRRAVTAVMILIVAVFMFGCESMERTVKDFQSELGGGLDRILTVYDYNGNEIKTYEGHFDLRPGDGPGKVVFDRRTENGRKRTIIHGGIVIVDEK